MTIWTLLFDSLSAGICSCICNSPVKAISAGSWRSHFISLWWIDAASRPDCGVFYLIVDACVRKARVAQESPLESRLV